MRTLETQTEATALSALLPVEASVDYVHSW
jgi:hypothetical protein